jgi:hypothetical protein
MNMMVNPKDNRLLAAMNTDLYVALAPHFELGVVL